MVFKSVLALLLALPLTKFPYRQNRPIDIANKFFDDYKKEGIDKAIDYLFAINKYSTYYQESINEVKRSLTKALTAIGKYSGHELLSKKTAGQIIAMLTFIVKYKREPLTFRMLFYNSHSKWQVQNFKLIIKSTKNLKKPAGPIDLKKTLIRKKRGCFAPRT